MESVSGPWPTMSGKRVDALGVQRQQHVQGGLETVYCKYAHCFFSVYSMRDLRNSPIFVSHLFICACVFYSIHVEVREQVLELVFSLLPCRFLGSNLESQTQCQILLPS